MAPSSNPLDGAVVDLSARTKIRVTGQDRNRYLNGQITNDLRKATESNAIAACILNVKGKTDAHIFVSRDEESFVLDAAPELRENLSARLERYLIADDVQLADISDELSIFHVIGVAAPELPNARILGANRFGVSGSDIWSEASKHNEIFELLTANIPFLDEQQSEVLRIEQGIPRWGSELTHEIIPLEANLEESCVDYEKGCYIGQEVISRMKMSGQRNKRLCGLIAMDDPELVPGERLISATGKDVGWITSATQSERVGRRIALGYVKRGAEPPAGMKIVDLPFRRIGSD